MKLVLEKKDKINEKIKEFLNKYNDKEDINLQDLVSLEEYKKFLLEWISIVKNYEDENIEKEYFKKWNIFENTVSWLLLYFDILKKILHSETNERILIFVEESIRNTIFYIKKYINFSGKVNKKNKIKIKNWKDILKLIRSIILNEFYEFVEIYNNTDFFNNVEEILNDEYYKIYQKLMKYWWKFYINWLSLLSNKTKKDDAINFGEKIKEDDYIELIADFFALEEEIENCNLKEKKEKTKEFLQTKANEYWKTEKGVYFLVKPWSKKPLINPFYFRTPNLVDYNKFIDKINKYWLKDFAKKRIEFLLELILEHQKLIDYIKENGYIKEFFTDEKIFKTQYNNTLRWIKIYEYIIENL